MFEAVVFDMNGLLIDSEPLWVRAEIEVFGGVGVALTEEDCARTKGLRTDDVVTYWHTRRPWKDTSPAEVEAKLVARVAELVRSEGKALSQAMLRPSKSRARRAERRRSRRRRRRRSSSPPSTRSRCARRSASCSRRKKLPLGKPHPGIFLETAERLGVHPTRCLVLEDSLTGVIAAKAAPMSYVAVPFDYPKHDARFIVADAVIGSLESFTPELVARLSASGAA
ncbi:MAG: HAD-IA family hydrolase [Aquabacterium sp.]